MQRATRSVDHLVAHVGDLLGHVAGAHELLALLVDDLALVVHHVVEFQQVLADLEVARLDLLLRLLQRLVDPGMDDRLALLEAELAQHAVHALGAEDAHQVVFERQEELGGAGVALAAGAAAQLVVDAPALVALGADDVEAAGLRHHVACAAATSALIVWPCAARSAVVRSMPASSWRDAHVEVAAELDVGAAAGHVGGDGHGAGPAGLGDDVGFLLVVAGVQHLVRDLAAS